MSVSITGLDGGIFNPVGADELLHEPDNMLQSYSKNQLSYLNLAHIRCYRQPDFEASLAWENQAKLQPGRTAGEVGVVIEPGSHYLFTVFSIVCTGECFQCFVCYSS
jgi:hypothetical protein